MGLEEWASYPDMRVQKLVPGHPVQNVQDKGAGLPYPDSEIGVWAWDLGGSYPDMRVQKIVPRHPVQNYPACVPPLASRRFDVPRIQGSGFEADG